MAKNNFILYKDFDTTLDILNDEQAGKLFKALYKYVNGRNEPNFKDGMLIVSFNMLKTQLERDLVKYQSKVKINAENGKKGGLAKVANASERKKIVANLADSGSDSVSDIDSDIKKSKPKKDIIVYFNNTELDNLFKDFLKQRKTPKIKNSDRAIKLLLTALKPFSDDIKTQMIEKSIVSGWPNLYELKTNGYNTKQEEPLTTRYKDVPIIR